MRLDNKITVPLFNAILLVVLSPVLVAFIAAYYSDRLTTRLWDKLIKKPQPDQWSKWFAWHPISCGDDGWRWLQTVYRKPWTFHEIIEYRISVPTNQSNVGKSDE